jgi:hypothetical protein
LQTFKHDLQKWKYPVDQQHRRRSPPEVVVVRMLDTKRRQVLLVVERQTTPPCGQQVRRHRKGKMSLFQELEWQADVEGLTKLSELETRKMWQVAEAIVVLWLLLAAHLAGSRMRLAEHLVRLPVDQSHP